jgi:hypothetical protein
LNTLASLRRLIPFLMAYAIAMPATAATRPYRFTVSATVVEACAIAPLTPSLLESVLKGARNPCAGAPALSAIAAPQPVVALVRDATGLTSLTIEF